MSKKLYKSHKKMICGVCAGIAYTTNVLLRKAGIESYELISNDHGWNLIDLDGK